jgi:hypothetical protein
MAMLVSEGCVGVPTSMCPHVLELPLEISCRLADTGRYQHVADRLGQAAQFECRRLIVGHLWALQSPSVAMTRPASGRAGD